MANDKSTVITADSTPEDGVKKISSKTGMLIDGIAASQAIDSSGEVLDVKGCDISTLDTEGVINWEHRGDESNGHSSLDIVGKIVFAKKIFKRDDCSTDRQRKYWDLYETPYIYIIGRLYDAAGHAGAQGMAAQIRDHLANDEAPLVRFSIEGTTLKTSEDKKVLKESVARRVAATIKPCNRSAISGVLADPNAPAGFNKDPEGVLGALAVKKTEFTHPRYSPLGGSVGVVGSPFLSDGDITELQKAWPKDDAENTANMQSDAVLKDHLLGNGIEAAGPTVPYKNPVNWKDAGVRAKVSAAEQTGSMTQPALTYPRLADGKNTRNRRVIDDPTDFQGYSKRNAENYEKYFWNTLDEDSTTDAIPPVQARDGREFRFQFKHSNTSGPSGSNHKIYITGPEHYSTHYLFNLYRDPNAGQLPEIGNPQWDSPVPPEVHQHLIDNIPESVLNDGYRYLRDLHLQEMAAKAPKDIKKAITAGNYNVAPGSLVGGAALQVEDLRRRKVHAVAKAALRDWSPEKGDFKKFLKAQMPEASDQFIDLFTDAVDKYKVKKSDYLLTKAWPKDDAENKENLEHDAVLKDKFLGEGQEFHTDLDDRDLWMEDRRHHRIHQTIDNNRVDQQRRYTGFMNGTNEPWQVEPDSKRIPAHYPPLTLERYLDAKFRGKYYPDKIQEPEDTFWQQTDVESEVHPTIPNHPDQGSDASKIPSKEEMLANAQKLVRKMEAISVELKKTVRTARDRFKGANATVEWQGNTVRPGRARHTPTPNDSEFTDYSVIGWDSSNHHVIDRDKFDSGSWTASDVKKIPFNDKNLYMHTPATVINSANVIDSQKHGDFPHNKTQKQKDLLHGLDLSTAETPADGATADTNSWVKHPSGSKVLVKGPNSKFEGETVGTEMGLELPASHREVIYHNIANDFFGLGEHVPTTALMQHPRNGSIHSAIDGVKNFRHVEGEYDGEGIMRANDDSEFEHLNTLQQADGKLDKMALMDLVMGNDDRHLGNWGFDAGNKLHLIDNSLIMNPAFNGYYSDRSAVRSPSYHRIWGDSKDFIEGFKGKTMRSESVHPEAAKWVNSLDPRKLFDSLREHGVPDRYAGPAMLRLAQIRDLVNKGSNRMGVFTLGKRS